jgi:hypothetical protein
MKRIAVWLAVGCSFAVLPACQKSNEASPSASSAPAAASPAPRVVTAADLTTMANAVPSTGPRDGNHYKVFFLVLRQNQAPAAGFKVDMSVKGKSQPVTKTTDEAGFVQWDDLPFPDAKHPLQGVLHYNTGKGDEPREISYPFIDGDAYRLKDTQYIPNTAQP